jgi:c-di-GMP-binding flagellar brake protein YcgR
MEKTMEHRTSMRKSVNFQVRYFYLPPDANPPSTYTIDLSTDGACIETLDPLQLGASVAFFIITPETQVIDVRAQVVHTEYAEHPPYRAGVHFTHLSPSDRATLQRAIESASDHHHQ